MWYRIHFCRSHIEIIILTDPRTPLSFIGGVAVHGNKRQAGNHPNKTRCCSAQANSALAFHYLLSERQQGSRKKDLPPIVSATSPLVYKFCDKSQRFWMCKADCTYSSHCVLYCLCSPVPCMMEIKCEPTLSIAYTLRHWQRTTELQPVQGADGGYRCKKEREHRYTGSFTASNEVCRKEIELKCYKMQPSQVFRFNLRRTKIVIQTNIASTGIFLSADNTRSVFP